MITVLFRSSSASSSKVLRRTFHPSFHFLISSSLVSFLSSNSVSRFLQGFSPSVVRKSVNLDFKFPEKIRVNKGEKIILCLFSSSGDKSNSLSVPRNPSGKMGALSVRPISDDDVMATLKGSGQTFLLEGSLCVRTYESDYGFVNWFKIFLSFLAVLIVLLIVFVEEAKSFIARLSFTPEKIYIALALIFGLVLVFITPPLQTPDEHDHLNRAYQLAELNIFQHESTVPTSLIHLFSIFGRLNFDAYKKTSYNEIIAQKKV